MATTTCTEIFSERSSKQNSGSGCFLKSAKAIVGSAEWKKQQEEKKPETKEEMAARLRRENPAYVEYWTERWRNHPLNNGVKWNLGTGTKFDNKADLQAMVELKDVIWQYVQSPRGKRKLMPTRTPLKFMNTRTVYSKKGEAIEVDRPYSTYYKDGVMQNDLFHELQLITSMEYNQKYKYQFTYGNFEAALYMTKRIWQRRLIWKKQKDNWGYVITPMCFDVLYSIAKYFDGTWAAEEKFHKKIDAWGEYYANKGDSGKWWAEQWENPPEISSNKGEMQPPNGQTIQESKMPAPPGWDEEKCKWVEDCNLKPCLNCAEFQESLEKWEELDEEIVPMEIEVSEAVMKEYVEELLASPEEVVKTEAQSREDTLIVTPPPEFDTEEPELEWDDFENNGEPSEEYWWDKDELPEPEEIAPLAKAVRKPHRYARHKVTLAWPFKWYPKIQRFDIRHAKKCKAETEHICLPIFTLEELTRNYFEGLPDIYMRIGRPELAEKCCCEPVRDFWKQKRRQFTMAHDNAFMNYLYDRLEEVAADRRPMSPVSEHSETEDDKSEREYEAQSDEGPPKLGAAPAPAAKSAGPATGAEAIEKPVKAGEKHVTLTYVDQRQIQKTKPEDQKPKQKEEDHAVKEIYSMLDVCKRPMFIDRRTWATTDEKGKEILTWVLPQVYFSEASSKQVACGALTASYVLSMFGAAKFDMKIRIVINSVKFQQGRLIGVWKPFYYQDKSEDVFNNYCQYPHVFIDASVSNPVELSIPWTNVRDSFPIYTDPHSELTYFGTFHLYVWNALMTGKTGSTDTTLSIYMWLENLDVYQLANPKDPSKIHFATQIIKNGFGTRKGQAPWTKQDPMKIKPKPVEREPQALEGILAAGTEMATALIADTGTNLVEHLLQALARGKNDKPNGFMPPQPVVPWIASNSAHGEGVDLSQRLSLEPLSITRPDKGTTAPANMRDLLKMWSRVGVVPWSVNDTENTSLGVMPMCPMLPVSKSTDRRVRFVTKILSSQAEGTEECQTEKKEFSFILDQRFPSMLDYLSHGFWFWRGSLVYKLEVVATSMHSGRLWVRYEPYASPNSAVKECEKQSLPGVVWDVQENKTIEISVPFSTIQPYLNTLYHIDVGEYSENSIGAFCCGMLEVTVLNRLKVTTGISDTVELNVYLSAGPDFEFFAPSPLDGIVGFQEWKHGLTAAHGVSYAKTLWEGFEEWWKELLFNGTLGDNKENIIGKTFTRVVNDKSKAYWLLPGYANAGLNIFTTSYVEGCKKASAKWKSIPWGHRWCNNQEEAFAVLKREPVFFTKTMKESLRVASGQPSELYWEKWLHACSILLIREHYTTMKGIPRLYVKTPTNREVHLLTYYTPSSAKEYEVQSNDKAGSVNINPFRSFTPTVTSTKSLSGETHMDIYKIMKRWSFWKSTALPLDLNVKHEAPDYPMTVYGWIMGTLQKMTTMEYNDYVWEMTVPVTPMTRIHTIGNVGHAFQEESSVANQPVLGDQMLINNAYDGGISVSSESGVTWSMFFGQLFRFWRGSMRYRFTFPRSRDPETPDWVLICYSPKEYNSTLEGHGQWRLATTAQMRQRSMQGSVLFNGNIMANIDVEVPFYSQFSRLYTSDATYDATTTAGSLKIYTPLKFDKQGKCYDKTDYKAMIKGLKMWIWTAVGDDFEFQVPVAAPTIALWPRYTLSSADLDFEYGGFDKMYNPSDEKWNYGPFTFSGLKKVTDADDDIQIKSSEEFVSPTKSNWGYLSDETHAKWKVLRLGADPLEPYEPKEEEKEKEKKEYEPQADDSETPPEGNGTGPVATNVPDQDTQLKGASAGFDTIPKTVTVEGDSELDGILLDTMEGLRKFNNVVGSLSTNLEPFLQNMTKVAQTVEEKATTLANEVTESSSVLKKGVNYAINGTRLGAFFYGIHSMLQAETWQERWFPLATCALALGLSPEVVTQAGEWLMGNVSSILSPMKVNEERKPQAWEDTWNNDVWTFLQEHSGTLRLIAAGIVTIITFYFTPTAPSPAKIKSFASDMVNKLRNMAFIGAGLKTLEWMFKWIAGVLKDAAIWAADMFSGGMITTNRLSAHYPEVLEWLAQVERYDLEAYRAPLHWDHEARIQLWRQIDTGNALTNKLASKAGPLYNTLTKGMIKLKKLDSEAQSVKNAPAFRMDPIHICFYGKAGVKKSSILTYVLGFIADELKYPVHNRFYPRCESEEHWNGYNGQLITLIDDLGQVKDGKAIEELISMKSNVCWHVPMAHLEDKGRCFTSKIIGSTTNILFPRPDNIVHYRALWRRRNVLIEVVQKYADTEDTAKTWSNLRFNILDPFPNEREQDMKTYLQKDLTMVQLMAFLLNAVQQWDAKQKSIVFAGLQGKTIDVFDYGDNEQVPREPIGTAGQILKETLRKGIVMTTEKLQECILRLQIEEIRDIINDERCRETIEKSPQGEEFFVLLRSCVTQWREMQQILTEPDLEKRYHEIQRWRNCMFKTIEVKLHDGFVCSINIVCHGTVLWSKDIYWDEEWKEKFKKTKQYTPEGFLDDFASDEARLEKEKEEMLQRAHESLRQREQLLNNYEEVTERILQGPGAIRRMKLSNDAEIEAFVVSNFSWAQGDQKASLIKQFKNAFDKAQKTSEDWIRFATSDETMKSMAKLFEEPFVKYWKKNKDNNWEFICNGVSDEEMEAYTLYAVLEEQKTQKEINEMLDNRPKLEDYKLSQMYHRLKDYYDKKKEEVTRWFTEHPRVTYMLKIVGALAGVFVGYKMLDWICPTIIGKIKAALAALFGWGVKAVGEERIEAVKTKGKELGAWTKRKGSEYLNWIKSLMKRSDDAEIREWSEEPELVELYAESLERMGTTVKNAVRMKTRVAPTEEGKRKVVNAYMMGQDRVHEGKERNREPETRELSENWLLPKIYEEQGCSDEGAKRLRDMVLTKNMVRAYWSSSEKSQSLMGVMVKGRYLLIPFHFWDGCSSNQPFVLTNRAGASYWEVFDPAMVYKLPDVDASLYLCSKRVGQFTDITKHFPMTNEVLVGQTPATLMAMTPDRIFTVQNVDAETETDVNYTLSSGREMHNHRAWEYKASTEKGDCGALLIAENTAMIKKILGMHVCGVKGQSIGTAAFIPREALEEAMENLVDDSKVKATTYIPESLIEKGIEFMNIQPQGNFDLHGAVAPRNAVRLPHKTEIQPSPIHDMVRPHVTEPSILTTSDPRLKVPGSPLLRAINKYGKPTMPFPKQDVRAVFNHIKSEVMYWRRPTDARLLTDWEAVFGNEYIEYCDRMNLGASPGYPWTLSRPSGEKGKAYLFDINATDGIASEDFRRQYRLREELAKKGIRRVSVWTDCLKDERRPLEKIAAGKTRAFMLPPADFVMLCRKYFMMFNVTFYSNRINSFSAVGIDPYSYEWTRVVRKLKRNSNLAFAGDFHSFDGIFDSEFMWQIMKIINEWYQRYDINWKEEDDIVRQVLTEEMIHTVHIVKNSIYEKHQGNPSGNPLTVVVNTFAHYAYILLAWLGLARKYSPENLSLYHFGKQVAAVFYGDDGLYTVKREASEWFNCKGVSEYLAEYGIEYTDEAKSGELYKVRPLTECTFLKNGFVKMEDQYIWLAPIKEDTIYELTNWVRKSENPVEQLRANLADVFSFAYHHGEKFFWELLVKVNEALESRGLRTFDTSYELEKEKFLAKCIN